MNQQEKKMPATLRRCLVKSNIAIHMSILSQFSAKNLDYKEVINDAKERGMIFDKAALSKYFKAFDSDGKFTGYVKGCLSQENIIWLCVRYGIEVNVTTRINRRLEQKDIDFKLKKIFGLNGGKSVAR